MVSALVLLVASQRPATVTLSHPCAHSSVVLKAFGEAIGEVIKPGGSVQQDYFLVRFDQMPVVDAKLAIAKALNATWTESGGVLYLTRTRAQELAEVREMDEAYAKAVEKGIRDEIEADGKRKAYDGKLLAETFRNVPKEDTWDFDLPESPSTRLYSRLIASLSAKELLALPDGKVKYSTKPSGDELPLPKAWREAYAKFVSESAVWREAVDSVYDEEDERRSYVEESGGRLDEIATFELEVKGRDISIGMTFEWEEGGCSMGYGGIGYADRSGEGFEELLDGVTAKAKTDAETRKIWRAPKWAIYGFDSEWDYSSVKKLSMDEVPETLRRTVLDMEHNEPLAELVSWPFIQLAEAKAENFVVLMPDSVVDWPFATGLEETTTLSDLVKGWWSLPLRAERDKELKCWYLVPADRPGARAARTDRPAFARLLRAVSARGWMGLREVSDYVGASGATEIESGFASLLSIAANDEPYGYSPQYISLAVQIFGALTAAQRNRAWGEGIEVPIEQWPVGVQRALADYDWTEETFDRESDSDDEIQGAQENAPKVEKVLKRGLPRGTTLRIAASNDQALWIRRGESRIGVSLDSVGWLVYESEQNPQSLAAVTGFAPSATERLAVAIRVPGAGTFETDDRFRYTPFDSEYKPLEKLDPGLRDAIKESIKKIRDGGGARQRLR